LCGDSLTAIGSSAFIDCVNLTNIYLNKVTSIGYRAFAECPLNSITINPDNEAYE
jgi:hypothetical protein